jgi:hypothetical protein
MPITQILLTATTAAGGGPGGYPVPGSGTYISNTGAAGGVQARPSIQAAVLNLLATAKTAGPIILKMDNLIAILHSLMEWQKLAQTLTAGLDFKKLPRKIMPHSG